MADKQVVRQDVVQITWDVEKSPFGKINKEINGFAKDTGNATKKGVSGFQKIQNSAKGFGKELQKLDTKNLDKINSKLDKMAGKLGKGVVSGAKKAAKALSAITVAGSAGAFKLADMASDLDETMNKVEVAFGKNGSKVVKNWSKDSIKSMGLAQQSALDMAALFGDMGTGMGLSQSEAANMSMELTQLGADLASFKNIGIDQATTALNGIFTGETESLKTLGIVMTQTNLDAFAMANGFGKTTKEMSESEKVMLRYQYVMSKTKNAQGDFARTGGGFANQLRMAKEQLKQIGTTVGGVFIGGFEKALNKLNSFGAELNTKLSEVFSDGFQFGDIAKITPLLGPVGTVIQNIADKIKAFTSNGEKMQLVKDIFASVKTTAGTVLQVIGQLATKMWNFLTSTNTLKTVKDIFGGISDAVKWAKDHMDGIITTAKILGAAFLGVYGAVKTVTIGMKVYNGIMKVSNLLSKIKAAREAFSAGKTFAQAVATKTATGAQIGFNAAMLASPITWIVVGIVALIAVIILLAKNWDKVKEVASKCWDKIKSVWGKVSDWFSSKVVDPLKDKVSKVKNAIADGFQWAYDKVTNAWSGIKDFFSGIWKDAVKAVAKPVNKLIGGANWVLEKLGSDKKFEEWQPYARGTKGHPGGNAIVNDGRGAELVQMPNGRTFIPRGRNVLLPNAPKGMKVLDAQRTARLMGRSPTFNYEEGTGWDIWGFFDNAKGLVEKVIDKFISYKGVSGYALDVGKALVKKATGAMVSWVKNLFKDSGGKDLGSYVASKGVEQWRSTVAQALKMEGMFSDANVKRTLYQMQTESGGNPRAINLWDRNAKRGIPSKGLMQVIDPTFKAYARKGYNTNIYDPLSNILASVRYAVSRYGSLEKAYRGVGYAGGVGRIRLPVYSPASAAPVSGGSTNTNNYSPSFTLNMSGTVDRTTERTIKKWVKEAMDEAFESIERTNRRLTEV